MESKKILHIARLFIPLALVFTALSGLVYISVQQSFRQSANDPQIQISEDGAADLSSGVNVSQIVPPTKVDISVSLAPFVIIFDTSGNPIASSAILSGQTPTIPPGVFNYINNNGEDRFTWQPTPGVREAVVVNKYSSGNAQGYILAGRSLREIEKREDNLQMEVVGTWLATLLVTFVVTLILV